MVEINTRQQVLPDFDFTKSMGEGYKLADKMIRDPIEQQQADDAFAQKQMMDQHTIDRFDTVDAQTDAAFRQKQILDRQKIQERRDELEKIAAFDRGMDEVEAGTKTNREMAEEFPVLYGEVVKATSELDEVETGALRASGGAIYGLLRQKKYPQVIEETEGLIEGLNDADKPAAAALAQTLIDAVKTGDPEQIKGAERILYTLNSVLGGDEKTGPFDVKKEEYRTALAKLNADFAAGKMTRPDYEAAKKKLLAITGTTENDPSVVTKKNIEKSQNAMISGENTLATVQALREDFEGDFLTIPGEIKSNIAKWADKLALGEYVPPEWTEFMERRTGFIQNNLREFNAYRKEITGAAASILELRSLEKAMMNPNQSPREWLSSLAAYEEAMVRSMEVHSGILKDGIQPFSAEGKREYAKRARIVAKEMRAEKKAKRAAEKAGAPIPISTRAGFADLKPGDKFVWTYPDGTTKAGVKK